MERKAWWAAGTLGVLILAGLVTAGIAASSQAKGDDDNDKDKVKTKRYTIVSKSGERSAFLGVRTSEDTDSDQGGAHVDEVVDGSPADRAGIEEGDVIVSFDGSEVRGPRGLTERIHKASPKDKVEVGILRDGKRETVDVTLGERSHTIIVPRDGERIEVPLPDTEALEDHLKGLRMFGNGNAWVFKMGGGRPKLGVQLVETTPELREHLGGGRDRGVLVGKVMSGTPAEKAGLKVGDLIVSVDGDTVSDAGELIEAIGDKDGETLHLEVVRDGRTIRLEATLPAEEEDDDEVSGPRADLDRLHEELRAAQVARQAELETLNEARQAERNAVRQARQGLVEARRAELEAMRSQRRAMRDAREQLRRELMQAQQRSVI